LFKGSMPWTQALLVLGGCVIAVSLLTTVVRFSEDEEKSAEREIAARLAGQFAAVPAGANGD
ncbi:MAG TPA: hypothetical protein VHA14_03790, partial [Bryobacteraceae bacterium]|nr:hypothetical protein [Bryobacteraceae bacterium]